MSELEYAPPRPGGRADRWISVVLLVMQVTALVVFAGNFVLFWWTATQVAIEVAIGGDWDDDYLYSFTYSASPLMMSTIAFAACGILRRMLNRT